MNLYGSLHGLLSSVFNVSMAINMQPILDRYLFIFMNRCKRSVVVKIHILLQIFHIAQIIFDLQMQIDV